MAVRSFLPDKDAALLAWSVNFVARISEAPSDYGLSLVLVTAYIALHDAFAAAYQTAVDPITRTKGKVAAKNAARTALKADARLLAKIVEGTATVTDEQKIDLGLNVRKTPTPVPVPSASPNLDVVSVVGRTVKIRLHGDEPGRRGKPDGVKGASLFSYVGATPPEDVGAWKFEGSSTRTEISVEFPATVQPGTKVWLTAFWFNTKSQSGPACAPVGTYLSYNGLSMAA
jgi:hypothetical protein